MSSPSMKCKDCGVDSEDVVRFLSKRQQCGACYDKERRANWTPEQKENALLTKRDREKRINNRKLGDLLKSWRVVA